MIFHSPNTCADLSTSLVCFTSQRVQYLVSTPISVQVAGGDDLDLVMLLLQSVKAWTDQGLLEPLDDYLAADAPYISEFV